MTVVRPYVERSAEPLIHELFAESPALLITGPRAYRLDDGIVAAPICTLWA